MEYKYYSKRPVMIGTQPKGFTRFVEYERYTFVAEIGREVWSEIYYDRELTPAEIADFELFCTIK